MFTHPGCHRLHCDFCRPPVGEAEYSCGYAAEGHAFQTIFFAHIKCIPITVCQILFKRRCQFVLDDRTNDVNDFLRRKVVPVCQHRNRSRLLIVPAISDPQLIHLPVALSPQLYAGVGMNAIINTGMHRHKASKHLRVRRIYDCVHGKPCDIALPDGKTVPDFRYI